MAHIVINDTTPLDSYTATGGQTEFTVTFPFFTDASLKVYLTPNGQTADDATDILTLTTDYTVTGAGNVEGATKKITLTAGSYPSGATAGDTVVIRRDEPIARTSDLAAQGDFSSETYNDEQDIVIMILQQLEEALGRTLVGEVTGGPFDAGSRIIENLSDPANGQDAATKAWTSAQILAASGIGTPSIAGTNVSYDNTSSGLTATEAQAAIDEVEARLDTAETNISSNDTDISAIETDLLRKYPRDHISGLAFTITTDDSADDSITVGAGETVDSGNDYDIDITAAIQKNMTDTWASGTGNGGVGTSVGLPLTADTRYKIYALTLTTDQSQYDVILSDSEANAISDAGAGFDKARHIGYVRTGATATAMRDAWRITHPQNGRRKVDQFTASSDATADLFGTLPSGRFVVELDSLTPATNNVHCQWRVGNSSTIDTGANYDYQNAIHRATTAYLTASGQTACVIGNSNSITNVAAAGGISGEILVNNMDQAKYTVFSYSGGFDSNGANRNSLTHHSEHSSAAVQDMLQFFFSSGNIASGVIRLYELD